MFYEHAHELVFELDGLKASEVAAVVRYALWAIFADEAKVFGQKVENDKFVVEVRTDYPDDARMSIAAAAIHYMMH